MICYKDMTFYAHYKTCETPCGRALTPEVKADAEKWMKNAPICMFSDKPECWKEKNKESYEEN